MVGHRLAVLAPKSPSPLQSLLNGRGDYCNEFLGLINLAKYAATGKIELDSFVLPFLKNLRDNPSSIPTFSDYKKTKPIDTQDGKLLREIASLCGISEKIIALVSELPNKLHDKHHLREIFDTLRDFLPLGYTDHGIIEAAVKAYDGGGGFSWQDVLNAIDEYELQSERFRAAALPSNGKRGARIDVELPEEEMDHARKLDR